MIKLMLTREPYYKVLLAIFSIPFHFNGHCLVAGWYLKFVNFAHCNSVLHLGFYEPITSASEKFHDSKIFWHNFIYDLVAASQTMDRLCAMHSSLKTN